LEDFLARSIPREVNNVLLDSKVGFLDEDRLSIKGFGGIHGFHKRNRSAARKIRKRYN